MTILWAGGEDTSGVTFVGSAGASTAGTLYRTSYSRCELAVQASSTADPPAHRITLPTFTAQTVVWFHCYFVPNSGVGVTSGNQAIIFRSSDGVSRVVFRQTSTSGLSKVSSRNSVGTFVDLATATTVFTAGIGVTIDIKIDYSASGSVTMWFSGVQVLAFSGDPRTDSATDINQIELGEFSTTQFNGWSELIIADEDTRGMALWTLAPQAAGSTQSWLPNTVGNINETILSDTTVVGTSNADDLSLWTTPTSPPITTLAVKAIVQEARVRVGTTGPQHFDWAVRTASTNFLAGESNAPAIGGFTTFSNYQWTSNPNTSNPWALGDIASGFNLGIKSLA